MTKADDNRNYFVEKYFDIVNEPEAKFILEHSEKQLKELNEAISIVTTRTITLITIIIGFIVTLIGFIVGKLSAVEFQKVDTLTILAALSAIYLLAVLYLLASNLTPKTFYSTGSEPKMFFTDELFNTDNKDYRLIAIYVNEIHEYQVRIEHNKKLIDERWQKYKFGLSGFKFFPIAIVLITVAYYLLHK
ncbi:MAG: hypothetical protein QM802_22925 [Agriterribacter sp.]